MLFHTLPAISPATSTALRPTVVATATPPPTSLTYSRARRFAPALLNTAAAPPATPPVIRPNPTVGSSWIISGRISSVRTTPGLSISSAYRTSAVSRNPSAPANALFTSPAAFLNSSGFIAVAMSTMARASCCVDVFAGFVGASSVLLPLVRISMALP